jgi:hypothetical protein
MYSLQAASPAWRCVNTAIVRGIMAMVCVWATLCAYPSFGQEFRSVLTGQVTDPSGAVIRGATVTAVEVSTGTNYTGKTSDKGVYYIPYVLPGTYRVTAEASGFKIFVQDNVLLKASVTFSQNFQLEVGSRNEKVEVTTAPPDLETTTASNNTVISSQMLQSIPLNGGQPYTMISTVPGSQFTQTQFGNGGAHGTTGYDVSNSYTLGGGIVGNNQFTLNGTNITSQYTYDNHGAGEWSVSPNLDAIEEVNVMTTTYDARYGRTSGGTVNVVTKGGTNQYHASARYAYEGALMNANTYQNNLSATPRQGWVQNQFWLTAGGPIKKSKLLWFFGFEGYRQSLAGTLLLNVPPAYMRPGFNGNSGVDFSQVGNLDPAEFPTGLPVFQPGTATCLTPGTPVTSCNSNYVVQTEFPGDTIPSTQLNATALAVLKYIPLPNIAGASNLARGNNYLAIDPSLYDYNQPMARVDYNLSERTKLYSYFLWWKGSEYKSTNGLSGVAANGNINYTHQTMTATQDVTHVFSPSLVGDFKISYNRFYESSPDGDLTTQTDPSTIGLSMPMPTYTTSKYLPEFTVGDGWGTGFVSGKTVFGNQLNADVTNNYTLDVDFTKSHGSHNLEFGGEIDEFQYGGRPYSGGHPNGDFDFKSQWTQLNPQNSACYPITPGAGSLNACTTNDPNGSAMGDFYLGYPYSGGIDWDPSIAEGYPVYAVYFQDNWRVTHRLSLNLGLRYDVQRGLRERHNQLNRGVCLTCVNPLTNDPTYQTNIANSSNISAWNTAGINTSSLSTVLGGIEFAGVNGQSRDAYNTDWTDLGPRFGAAYTLNSKTVIRGGVGVMYSYGLEGGSSMGFTQTTNYTTSLNGGNDPTNYFQTGSPFASGLLVPQGASQGLLSYVGDGTIQVDFPDRRVPTEKIFSFGIQRELPGGNVLDVRYAGNYSSRLRVGLWLNGVATLAEQQAAQANPAIWNQQVPNPYYGVSAMSGPGQCGTSTTIKAIALMQPGSQYCSPGGVGLIGQYNAPLGHNWYNGLEVKLSHRASHGLDLQVAYTYSKTINGDGYQNGWPYQDPKQEHWIAGTDRTHVLTVTSVYELPFGSGKLLVPRPGPILGTIINNWTLSGLFNAESGFPASIDTGYWFTCSGQSFKSPSGTSVGSGTWLNQTSGCWESIPTYGLMDLPGNTAQVRDPIMPNLDLSLQKAIQFREGLNFQLRLDAFNAFNGVLFGGPDNNPGDGPATFSPNSGWSGFGTVGATQQNFPRILQVSGKIYF